MKRLVVASHNLAKVREIRALLESLGVWDVQNLPAGTPEAEETGSTFLENAVQKSEFYGRLLGGWTLADDSGLEVDALGGRPGIYSARYADTDLERNAKLLAELAGREAESRRARFVCALALASEGRTLWTTLGRIEGEIALEPYGHHGFGYDPVFWLPELGRTMGELAPEVKNQISHRGQALAALRHHLGGLDEPDR